MITTYDVVVIGSGFGAIAAAKVLGKAGKSLFLISNTAEYLFQPLLYQVATGMIAAQEIAPPASRLLARYGSAEVRRGHVDDVQPDSRHVIYSVNGSRHTVGYRHLIVATGAAQDYFGRDEFRERTFALKTIDDAAALREQIVRCYERAYAETHPGRRQKLLSFVVVGAGATGVELAGHIRDLSRRYFAHIFPSISPDDVTVTLVDGAPEVLPAFGGRLSGYARDELKRSGVDVVTGAIVTDIADGAVSLRDGGTSREWSIIAETVVWSAGVRASELASTLAERTGCATDRAGRLLVNSDLTVGAANDIYAVGDVTSLNGLPGQSPVAMQQGRHAARLILGKISSGTPFRYVDKGSMSIIGRFSAVARLFGRIDVSGPVAWLLWLGVHLIYLVGLRSRFIAVVYWVNSYIGNRRSHLCDTEKSTGCADDSTIPREATPHERPDTMRAWSYRLTYRNLLPRLRTGRRRCGR